jgi:transcriptional regulator with XRE-family HTH domain
LPKRQKLDVDQLLTDFRYKAKSERGFIARIAEKTGIKRDNLYKWARGATPSDPNDLFLLADFVDNEPQPEESKPIVPEPEVNYKTPPDREKYLALLEKTNDALMQSVQLSLNAIQMSLADLLTFARENDNRTLKLLEGFAAFQEAMRRMETSREK